MLFQFGNFVMKFYEYLGRLYCKYNNDYKYFIYGFFKIDFEVYKFWLVVIIMVGYFYRNIEILESLLY